MLSAVQNVLRGMADCTLHGGNTTILDRVTPFFNSLNINELKTGITLQEITALVFTWA